MRKAMPRWRKGIPPNPLNHASDGLRVSEKRAIHVPVLSSKNEKPEPGTESFLDA